MKKKIKSIIGLTLLFVFLFSYIAKNNVVNAVTYNYNQALVGTKNLNETKDNSAKVGDQLLEPEIGWKRYDDKNSKIQTDFNKYCASGLPKNQSFYMDLFSASTKPNAEFRFSFRGKKFRIISPRHYTSMDGVHTEIYADGANVKKVNFSGHPAAQYIVCEYSFNKSGNHTVIVRHKDPSNGKKPSIYISAVDAIDVDGDLIDYIK